MRAVCPNAAGKIDSNAATTFSNSADSRASDSAIPMFHDTLFLALRRQTHRQVLGGDNKFESLFHAGAHPAPLTENIHHSHSSPLHWYFREPHRRHGRKAESAVALSPSEWSYTMERRFPASAIPAVGLDSDRPVAHASPPSLQTPAFGRAYRRYHQANPVRISSWLSTRPSGSANISRLGGTILRERPQPCKEDRGMVTH